MLNEPQIQHSYEENVCTLRIPIPKASDMKNERRIENIRNCDFFVEENNFLIYIDVKLYRLHLPRKLNIANLKHSNPIEIYYDTKERILKLHLPCESPCEIAEPEPTNPTLDKSTPKFWRLERNLDLWKLKRITPHCRLRIDNNTDLVEFDSSYDYGFASKFKGKIQSGENDLGSICRMSEPNTTSPIQRSIDREVDELKGFDRDQYKVNFIDLQVADGHDNPMNFNMIFQEDCTLSRTEECLMHNLLLKPGQSLLPEQYNQSEIDCGLVSIFLAICYDVRTTSNEPTCESGWTRSILSPALYYFETFTNIKDVVIAFLRRSLIYPLYRNYDLGRLCVEDAIDAMHRSARWVAKQLLVTQELFASSCPSREVYNRYYIEDYIRYVSSEQHCPASHLKMLANNLKNVFYDISKKQLRLDLFFIESEVLREISPHSGMHINASTTSEEETTDDDDDEANDDDGGTASDEYETETSSASETDENSVIEQCIEEYKP